MRGFARLFVVLLCFLGAVGQAHADAYPAPLRTRFSQTKLGKSKLGQKALAHLDKKLALLHGTTPESESYRGRVRSTTTVALTAAVIVLSDVADMVAVAHGLPPLVSTFGLSALGTVGQHFAQRRLSLWKPDAFTEETSWSGKRYFGEALLGGSLGLGIGSLLNSLASTSFVTSLGNKMGDSLTFGLGRLGAKGIVTGAKKTLAYMGRKTAEQGLSSGADSARSLSIGIGETLGRKAPVQDKTDKTEELRDWLDLKPRVVDAQL